MRQYISSMVPARRMGGQQVGTDPGIIRVELKDDDGFVVCSAEVNARYHARSQHKARELAIAMIEIALTDFRDVPPEAEEVASCIT